jgi:DmsE family decaheme c-type cytochrome
MAQFKGALLAALLAMLGAGHIGDAQAQQARQDKVLKGDAQCTRCHDETEEYPVLAIGKTKHGTVADGRTPTCTSCHGESDLHVNRPPDAKERPKPDRMFGKASATPMEQRSAACLSCHQGETRIHWQASAHSGRDVACTSCHQIHTGHDRVRDKVTQTDVCFACHKEQRSQINRPSHHPIREGKMACSNCHNVHGSNPKQLVRATVNETCYACHMEKRGPFVHNHQPVTEDCTICHQPHGTVIQNLLKARPPYLCQECHSHSSHPGQVPGLPPGRTTSNAALGTVARGCLNCHTNIHGSNSTINSATSGRFRR